MLYNCNIPKIGILNPIMNFYLGPKTEDEDEEDNGDYTSDDWYGGSLNPNWEPGDDDDCGIN